MIPTCEAAEYGCDFKAKRPAFDEHSKSCPLVKLAPFLKSQNEQLEAHRKALDHLTAKNNILETGLFNVTQTLETEMGPSDAVVPPTVGLSTQASDSTIHHLLYVQESLRRDVERVSIELTHLDAKASMMILNESLRVKDEMAHTNAAVNGMRTQLHYLTVANQQRTLPTRSQPASEGGRLGTSVRTSESSGSLNPRLVRRLSDSTRQETKL
ncbi:MAG: hypothetical protein Q9201_005805 [Fulgogasparrea decipioides]